MWPCASRLHLTLTDQNYIGSKFKVVPVKAKVVEFSHRSAEEPLQDFAKKQSKIQRAGKLIRQYNKRPQKNI